ncbi:MAG: glycosyltransferase [Planctomycetota bacterium]
MTASPPAPAETPTPAGPAADTHETSALAAPSLSIVFPTHNEEPIMAQALMDAVERRDEYPAPVEIIVACNGCTDRSADIARLYPVHVIEDERSGMSFGNNLGGWAAQNDMILFWDVDTRIGPGGLAAFAQALKGCTEAAGGFRTLPDKVYPRSVVFYGIMNLFCRRKRVPPAGTTFVSRSVYRRINGFDESIPQGTGSDIVRRAQEAGARFVWVDTDACRTSVRRFEKRGYLRQLLDWRRNIRAHAAGRKDEIVKHDYEVIR